MSISDPSLLYDAETLAARELVNELSQQLDCRLGDIDRWQKYYDGEQPLKFATEEYRRHFGKQYEGFRDNWCAPVVDTTAEKLTVAGIWLPSNDQDRGRTADREFARWWHTNHGPAQSSQAFTEACIAKRAFALVWGDGDGTDTPGITFESPDEVIVGYEPGARWRRKAALKRWTDGTKDYATLYLRDWCWKWEREHPGGSKLWTPDELKRYQWLIRQVPLGGEVRVANPSGVVPMVELPNRPRLKTEPLSEVEGAASMQDAINALWSYLFTSADFAALPQRVVLGAITPKVPILGLDGKPTGAYKQIDINEALRPASIARMMAFEGENASIAQWDAAKLSTFTEVIEFAVGHLAAQSRTPAHYFTGKISNVPEGGLIALAQAHISKVRERAVYHSDAIKEIAAVGYLMLGQADKAAAARAGTVKWEDFELRSEGQMADLAVKMRQAGFSFEYVAQRFISDPVELADEIERHEAEETRKAAMLEFGPKFGPSDGGEVGGG